MLSHSDHATFFYIFLQTFLNSEIVLMLNCLIQTLNKPIAYIILRFTLNYPGLKGLLDHDPRQLYLDLKLLTVHRFKSANYLTKSERRTALSSPNRLTQKCGRKSTNNVNYNTPSRGKNKCFCPMLNNVPRETQNDVLN